MPVSVVGAAEQARGAAAQGVVLALPEESAGSGLAQVAPAAEACFAVAAPADSEADWGGPAAGLDAPASVVVCFVAQVWRLAYSALGGPEESDAWVSVQAAIPVEPQAFPAGDG